MKRYGTIGLKLVLVAGALALVAPGGRAADSQTQQAAQLAPTHNAADAALRGQVIRLLSSDPDVRMLALAVEVQNGIVVVRGQAPNLKRRDDAQLVAGRVHGRKLISHPSREGMAVLLNKLPGK